MKLLNLLNKIILTALAPLPIIGEPIRALNVYHKIKSLEKLERFEQARIVRKKAIETINQDYQGPLLRSEGQDKLYRLKDYEAAIEAFERAEIAMEKSAFLYGVSQPDGVLSGIAIAAVRSGDKNKAIIYRDKFTDMYERLKNVTKKKESLKWHEETIAWLNDAIDSIV
jgi:tetratricopeptide (TPR) repeat protein